MMTTLLTNPDAVTVAVGAVSVMATIGLYLRTLSLLRSEPSRGQG